MKSPIFVQSLALSTALAFGFPPTFVGPLQVGPQFVEAARKRPAPFSGKVTWVYDGDTLKVGERKIRLAEIDTPESDQPYGQEAKQTLMDFVRGRTVKVVPVETDRYGRTVAKIIRDDGLYVNAAMVEVGAAHVYRKYSNDPQLLVLEEAAKRDGEGLWALPKEQRIPPNLWREGQRGEPSVSADFDCAVRKTKCGQMDTCDEARFYLIECNVWRLDGNDDGVPCQSLCR